MIPDAITIDIRAIMISSRTEIPRAIGRDGIGAACQVNSPYNVIDNSPGYYIRICGNADNGLIAIRPGAPFA